jgi:hypothetical protein
MNITERLLGLISPAPSKDLSVLVDRQYLAERAAEAIANGEDFVVPHYYRYASGSFHRRKKDAQHNAKRIQIGKFKYYYAQ